jgi:hypothetical protein
MTETWHDSLLRTLEAMGTRLLDVLPALLMLLALLAVGLALAWTVSRVTVRLARALDLDRRAGAYGVGLPPRREGRPRRPSDLLGLAVFWGLLLLFAALAIDAMAVPGTGRITALVLVGLPTVVGALLILLIGWLVANFAAQGVLIAAVNAGMPEGRHLARAVRWGVLLFAGATAATHLGVAKEMLLVAFGILFGGVVLATSLAFGLGGRHIARQILERHLRGDDDRPHRRETLTHL